MDGHTADRHNPAWPNIPKLWELWYRTMMKVMQDFVHPPYVGRLDAQ